MLINNKDTIGSSAQFPCQQCLLSPIPPSYSSLKMGLTSNRHIAGGRSPRKARSPRRQGRDACRASSWHDVDRLTQVARRKNSLKSRSSGELAKLSLFQCNHHHVNNKNEASGRNGLVKSSSLKCRSSGEIARLSTFNDAHNDTHSKGPAMQQSIQGPTTERSVSCGDVAGLMADKQVKQFLKPRGKQRTVDAVALQLRGSHFSRFLVSFYCV